MRVECVRVWVGWRGCEKQGRIAVAEINGLNSDCGTIDERGGMPSNIQCNIGTVAVHGSGEAVPSRIEDREELQRSIAECVQQHIPNLELSVHTTPNRGKHHSING